MKRVRGLPIACAVILFTAAAARCDTNNLPAASNVVRRVIARGEKIARADESKHYTYDKRSVTSELDEKQRVTTSTEKLYKVALIGGMPFTRLVKVQGRALTAAELEKENKREIAFRQRVTGVDVKKKAEKKEAFATGDLAERFHFEVVKREQWLGRPTLLVTFRPKLPLAAEKSIADKVLNRFSGTFWVDEEEAEVTKLQATMRGPIPLGWFGAVGSLNRCNVTFSRDRLPDGVWVNTKSAFELAGRKLLSAMHIRTTEESSNFRREAVPQSVIDSQ